MRSRRAQGSGLRAWVLRLVLPALSLQPLALLGCRAAPAKPTARNLLLITIDTLRADHLGAYGYARARTSALDGLAASGALFEHAYAAAPITLPSHATLLTGRYPPGHGARDNGLHVSATVATLATELHAKGFATAAFVAAFPLDHQFGLARGFDVYGDRLPRGTDGKPANERPAADVVNDAIAWLRQNLELGTQNAKPPFFLWVHVFDPHAPYGDPSSARPAIERYDEEIATADREIGRLIAALGPAAANTVVVAAGDHGEAFGEHGEYAHSIFVYDTTLRVPLVMSGPGIPAGTRVADAVTLADVAPTVTHMLGFDAMKDVDGIDLSPALFTPQSAIRNPQSRELYAESFAPLVEFGWAPLRSVRAGAWKLIASPIPELFDVNADPGEQRNAIASQPEVAHRLDGRVARYSPQQMPPTAIVDAGGLERLRALGYAFGPRHDGDGERPDPKDRREVAARIAQVTAGELSGAALIDALEGILKVDAANGQAHLRLGYALLEAGNCARAEPEFRAAIDGGLPTTDAHLGLANCLGRRNDIAGAERVLGEALAREPDNPVLTANLGLVLAAKGDLAGAIRSLSAALAKDSALHEARFNLAVVYAKSGRRTEAAAAARELLARLPANAPQRPEVERLLKAVR